MVALAGDFAQANKSIEPPEYRVTGRIACSSTPADSTGCAEEQGAVTDQNVNVKIPFCTVSTRYD